MRAPARKPGAVSAPRGRWWRSAVALGLGLLGTWVAVPAVKGGPAGAARDSVARPKVYSIENSPGYVPLVDPESTSVLIGRRLNAPRVSKPFHGGARSLDDLGRRVCRALHAADLDSMLSLCIQDDEFRDILWREFPQSRPVTGLQWEDGWRVLMVRLRAGCMSAIHDWRGHYYEYVGVEADSVMSYKNFKMYSRLTLVARDDEGQVQRWGWLRAVVERKGSFKIYSMKD
jgi:hypothetical protein